METKEFLTLPNLAEKLGLSPLSVKLMQAAGAPGGEHFRPFADSLADVAKHFCVNRRTTYEWEKRGGLPRSKDGFDLDTIAAWRLQQADPPAGVVRKGRGKLARSIFRVLSLETRLAVADALADAEIDGDAAAALAAEIGRRLDSLFPDEAGIDRVIEECKF